MAELLQSCGWSLGDAGWAAVNWDITWLAAAIANEREERGAKLTSLSDAALAKIREEIKTAANQPTEAAKPKRTNRIGRTPPRLTPGDPKKPEDSPT